MIDAHVRVDWVGGGGVKIIKEYLYPLARWATYAKSAFTSRFWNIAHSMWLRIRTCAWRRKCQERACSYLVPTPCKDIWRPKKAKRYTKFIKYAYRIPRRYPGERLALKFDGIHCNEVIMMMDVWVWMKHKNAKVIDQKLNVSIRTYHSGYQI